VDLYTLVAMARGALEGRNAAEQTDYQRQQVEQQKALAERELAMREQGMRDDASYRAASLAHQKAIFDAEQADREATRHERVLAQQYLAYSKMSATERLTPAGQKIVAALAAKITMKRPATPGTTQFTQEGDFYSLLGQDRQGVGPAPTLPIAPAPAVSVAPPGQPPWMTRGLPVAPPVTLPIAPPSEARMIAPAATMPLKTQAGNARIPVQAVGGPSEALIAATGIKPEEIAPGQAMAILAERMPGAVTQLAPGGVQTTLQGPPTALQEENLALAKTQRAAALQGMQQSEALFPSHLSSAQYQAEAARISNLGAEEQLSYLTQLHPKDLQRLEVANKQELRKYQTMPGPGEAEVMRMRNLELLGVQIAQVRAQTALTKAQTLAVPKQTEATLSHARSSQTSAQASLTGAAAAMMNAQTNARALTIDNQNKLASAAAALKEEYRKENNAARKENLGHALKSLEAIQSVIDRQSAALDPKNAGRILAPSYDERAAARVHLNHLAESGWLGLMVETNPYTYLVHQLRVGLQVGDPVVSDPNVPQFEADKPGYKEQ
jgi:hypothetical protein